MSWHAKWIAATGRETKPIDANTYCPDKVKEAVKQVLSCFPEKAVVVECSGHIDSQGGGSVKIEVVGAPEIVRAEPGE